MLTLTGLASNMINLDLKKWFLLYNKQFFEDSLPRNTQVEWADLRGEGCVGMYTPGQPPLIQICHRLRQLSSGSIAKYTLMHEMAHVKSDLRGVGWSRRGWHGEGFENEMLRLAVLGALKGLW